MHRTFTPTDIQLGTDATTTNPTPRGEVNYDLQPISNMDRRFGVPVPIGARVQAGEIDGVVVASTDQLAIIRDDQGLQHAERWGVLMVQASGPAYATLPYMDMDTPAPGERVNQRKLNKTALADIVSAHFSTGEAGKKAESIDAPLPSKDTPAPREQGLIALRDDQIDQLANDPYRRAALRALDLLVFVDAMREEVESIEHDRIRAADQLADLEALLGQIADNRARRLLESEARS